jgi:hypothetical protein
VYTSSWVVVLVDDEVVAVLMSIALVQSCEIIDRQPRHIFWGTP